MQTTFFRSLVIGVFLVIYTCWLDVICFRMCPFKNTVGFADFVKFVNIVDFFRGK